MIFVVNLASFITQLSQFNFLLRWKKNALTKATLGQKRVVQLIAAGSSPSL